MVTRGSFPILRWIFYPYKRSAELFFMFEPDMAPPTAVESVTAEAVLYR